METIDVDRLDINGIQGGYTIYELQNFLKRFNIPFMMNQKREYYVNLVKIEILQLTPSNFENNSESKLPRKELKFFTTDEDSIAITESPRYYNEEKEKTGSSGPLTPSTPIRIQRQLRKTAKNRPKKISSIELSLLVNNPLCISQCDLDEDRYGIFLNIIKERYLEIGESRRNPCIKAQQLLLSEFPYSEIFSTHVPISIIGTGTYGTVYRLCDRSQKTEYVMKGIYNESMNDKELAIMIDNEVLWQNYFASEDLALPVIEFNFSESEDDDDYCIGYIVMERLDGTLVNILNDTSEDSIQLWNDEVLPYIEHVVNWMNDKNIYHLDLTLFNIGYIINDRYEFYIMDFGSISDMNHLQNKEYPDPLAAMISVLLHSYKTSFSKDVSPNVIKKIEIAIKKLVNLTNDRYTYMSMPEFSRLTYDYKHDDWSSSRRELKSLNTLIDLFTNMWHVNFHEYRTNFNIIKS